MKKCLLTSKAKQQLYKERTGLPLPPNPVITRFKTWLKTAEFYRKNIDLIKSFVNSLNTDSNNKSTNALKSLIDSNEFMSEPFAITEYNFLIDSIDKLLNTGLTLAEQKKILDESLNRLKGYAKEKLKKCLDKNIDLKTFCDNPDIEFRKLTIFAPITSLEVERSFSKYKNFLTDKRHRFTEENI